MAGYDLVIRGGTVYDGTGASGARADVGVRGERIAAVGIIPERGGAELDATGLAVSPGFIDVHSHDDFAVLLDPQMAFKVMQGVTTDVVGNCGSGIMPFESGRERFRRFNPGADPPRWDSFAGYMSRIDEAAPSCNVAVLMGHGTLRHGAMGLAQRAPSASELGRMRDWVREGVDAGAVGLSTGLIYEPGRYAATDEIIQLARELGADGGLYATHMRNEAEGLLAAVAEAIRVGEDGGVPVQISHHKASGRGNWGLVERSLALIDQARARGLDVTADQYPYTAGSTSLAAIVQNGAFRTDSPGGLGHVSGADVLIASAPKTPEWEGLRLSELGRRWALGDEEAARRVIDTEQDGCFVVIFIDGRGRRAPRDGAPDHHDRLRRRARRRQAAPAPLRHVPAGARPLREGGARPRPAHGHPPHDGDAGGQVQARRPRPAPPERLRRPRGLRPVDASPTPPPTKTPSASPPASAPSTSTAPGSPTTAPTRAPAPAARSAATRADTTAGDPRAHSFTSLSPYGVGLTGRNPQGGIRPP